MTYQPIDCDYYDEFVLRAMRRTLCVIHYCNATGDATQITDRILDVYSQDHAEFIKLAEGEVIRLDRVTKIEDVA
jgi:Rho-binding antiterminator